MRFAKLHAAVALAFIVAIPATVQLARAQAGAAVTSVPWSCLTASAVTGALLPAIVRDPACGSSTRSLSIHLGPLSPGRTSSPLVLPTPPMSLNAAVFGRTVVFTWNAPAAGEPAISYVVEAGSTAGRSDLASLDIRSTALGIAATSVPPGIYFVRVRARNTSGSSAASNEISVVVAAAADCGSAPLFPTGVTASVSGNTIALAWNAPTSGCPPTSYVIESVSAPGFADFGTVSTGNPATNFVLTGVPGGSYLFRVRSVNAAGTSSSSDSVRVVVSAVPCGGPPGPPSGLVSTIGGTTIAMRWNGATGSPTSYIIEAGSAPTLTNLIVTDTGNPATSLTITAAAGTYYIRLRARNNCGTGAPSNEITAVVDPGTTPPAPSQSLVQSSQLIYQGSFRLPLGDSGVATFAYGGTALAFNPSRGSLFLVGHDSYQQVAEVVVPPVVVSGTSVADLPTATLLQPLTDATEGRLSTLNPGDPNAKKIGGLLPYGGSLYMTGYSYYDGAATQVLSHFVSGLDLSRSRDVLGPFQVGSLKAGYVSGFMGRVPPEWQTALGGPVLTGQCCLSIIGRTSYGPAVSSVDPLDIGVRSPVPATPLLYYPGNHPLSLWDVTSPYFNGSTEVRGVVFPEGTGSVLFFGRHGIGTFCYGQGTSNQSLGGRPVPGAAGVVYCYDPQDDSKGSHGYPYAYYVWAYSAADLAAARSGQIQPWDVRPYAIWKLDFPFAAWSIHLNGAAYDPQTGRIFLSQAFADDSKPLIHVFTVQIP